MKFLIATDPHVSDRPKDDYRFGLFSWLAKQQKLHKVDVTFLLGDITENKDRHSATLVNRIVDELIGLEPPVYIAMGNHDCINHSSPFFRFLNCIDGINFVTKPTYLAKYGVFMIPHCRTQAEFNEACAFAPLGAKIFMCHQTFAGAISETSGSRLTGLQWPLVGDHRVYAGDVHKPQRIAPVTYVGAPYHIRFGDQFVPRVLLVDGAKEIDLHFDAPRKWSLKVRGPEDLTRNKDLRPGDQAKLTVEMAREEAVEWAETKKSILDCCKTIGLEVYGMNLEVKTNKQPERIKGEAKGHKQPSEVLKLFCQQENLSSQIRKAGMDLLK